MTLSHPCTFSYILSSFLGDPSCTGHCTSLSTSQDSLMVSSRAAIYSRNWHIMRQSLCKGHWHVLSTQGRDENAVFAVRLLIYGKGRELGDLVYVTTLQVGGARRLLCCSSGQGTLGCRLHLHLVLYPHTANTSKCKYAVLVYLALSVHACVALHRWYKRVSCAVA